MLLVQLVLVNVVMAVLLENFVVPSADDTEPEIDASALIDPELSVATTAPSGEAPAAASTELPAPLELPPIGDAALAAAMARRDEQMLAFMRTMKEEMQSLSFKVDTLLEGGKEGGSGGFAPLVV